MDSHVANFDNFLNPGLALVGVKIYGYLDNQNLIRCRLVNSCWKNFLDQDKLIWQRMIKTIRNQLRFVTSPTLDTLWTKLASEKSTESVKNFAVVLRDFYSYEEIYSSSEYQNISYKKLKFCESERLFHDMTEYTKIQFIFGHLKRLKLCWPFLKEKGDKFPEIGPDKSTLLHVCAREGNTIIFKYICEYLYNNHKNGIINLSNSKGVTPLHLAVKNENHKILHYILDHPAFFTQCKNPVDSIGQSCLHLAAIVGNLEAYKLISSYSHQINPCDPNGSGITPLHNVMKHYESKDEGGTGQHLYLARWIINRIPGDKNPQDNISNQTPLHLAALNADLEIVQYLCNHLTDFSPRDKAGYVPLHEAARSGNLQVFKFLFKNAKNKDPRSKIGNSASYVATEMGQTEILKYLDSQAPGIIAINDSNRFLMTPLHCAAKTGHFESVQYLVEHCKDKQISMSLGNAHGDTPLHLATKSYRISVVMYLLEHVEIVNPVNLEGETPLYCATLLQDDRKLFDLMREKIHQRKLAVECKLAAARLVRATPSTKSLNQLHNQTFQNSK